MSSHLRGRLVEMREISFWTTRKCSHHLATRGEGVITDVAEVKTLGLHNITPFVLNIGSGLDLFCLRHFSTSLWFYGTCWSVVSQPLELLTMLVISPCYNKTNFSWFVEHWTGASHRSLKTSAGISSILLLTRANSFIFNLTHRSRFSRLKHTIEFSDALIPG